MNDLLKQLRQLAPLAAAATAGPWIAYPDAPGDNEDTGPFPLIGVATAPGVTYTADQYGQPMEHGDYGWDFICSTAHDPDSHDDKEVKNFESNAEFIAAARNFLAPEHLPELLAALENAAALPAYDESAAAPAAKAAPEAAPTPGWVSVLERLPKEEHTGCGYSGRMLAYGDGGIDGPYFVAYCDLTRLSKAVWYLAHDNQPAMPVTHWMPLPLAPPLPTL